MDATQKRADALVKRLDARADLAASLDTIFDRFGDAPAVRQMIEYEIDQAAKRHKEASDA